MRHEKPTTPPEPMQPRAAGLLCLSCMNRKPDDAFRFDRRATKRGQRAYTCLQCEQEYRNQTQRTISTNPETVPSPNGDSPNTAAPANGRSR